MKAGKYILIFIGSVLIVTGLLFLIAAATSNPVGRGIVGIVFLGVGIAMIYRVVPKSKPGEGEAGEKKIEVVHKVDLPGKLKFKSYKCRNCSAEMSQKDAKFNEETGSIVFKCPYCESVFEVQEEPKW